jgi:NTE family protein
MTNTSPQETTKGTLLKVEDFTQHERVLKSIQKVKDKFPPGKPMIVSDVLDEKNNQYVNLVQKGGGVLGVALVGYTYVLETMGIRFLRQAGTSAGAINTALMTVIGKKEETKSEQVLDAICKLDFFSLVDGHPIARWLIKNFITHEDFTIRVKKWLWVSISILGVLIAGDIVLVGLQHKFSDLSFWAGLSFVLTGILALLITVAVIYGGTLLKRLKNAGFGINPGDIFYDWIKRQLIANGVHTVTDLKAKASAAVPGLHLREGRTDRIDDLEGDVTFITSELVTQNKIQFPEMCDLFRKKTDIDLLQPAGFVRASMSIPVFFESYMINNIPCTDPEIKDTWMTRFNEPDPPSSARFVDGGILSNFPINIFFNPKVTVPRLPAFGIDLDDSLPTNNQKSPAGWTLGGYAGHMFNTIRNYYDKDFLLKNKVYQKGIGTIHISGYNWLNFFLKPEDKKDMFMLGAEAAADFLVNFDWEDYKQSRSQLPEKLATAK